MHRAYLGIGFSREEGKKVVCRGAVLELPRRRQARHMDSCENCRQVFRQVKPGIAPGRVRLGESGQRHQTPVLRPKPTAPVG